MRWIAPSEKDTATATLEKRLWDAADQFRANSGLKAQEYSGPILGLIFLRFAEVRFAAQRAKLEKAGASSRRGSRVDEPAAYHAEGILYLPAEARFDYLLNLPEAENIGAQGQRGDARDREAQPAARRRAAQDQRCLLYPQKRTSGAWPAMSAKCQKPTRNGYSMILSASKMNDSRDRQTKCLRGLKD